MMDDNIEISEEGVEDTVKPVTRGHLNFEIGMSKLHFL